MSEEIPYIEQKDLNSKTDFKFGYYWTEIFEATFYINLAHKGFISTSNFYDNFGDILLPEMQESYAVLHFENLHISKKVKKLLKLDYNLTIGQDLELFIHNLKEYHGNECWLTKSYERMLYDLVNYNIENDNFNLVTTLLYKEDIITSGEIGYYIGNTYTSLTGFSKKEYPNWGTLQLVLLAKELKNKNIDFWNLGHPFMSYKIKLGAKVLDLNNFLQIWSTSTLPKQLNN